MLKDLKISTLKGRLSIGIPQPLKVPTPGFEPGIFRFLLDTGTLAEEELSKSP